MKITRIFGISVLLLIILVFALTIANFNPPVVFAQNTDVAFALQQVTPTPTVEDLSEIGSTDGILIMGIVIVVIVVTPVLFRRKKS